MQELFELWKRGWNSLQSFRFVTVSRVIVVIVMHVLRRQLVIVLQSKLKISEWIKPYINKTMKGIKYPSMVTWKHLVRGEDFAPALVWKSNMYVLFSLWLTN